VSKARKGFAAQDDDVCDGMRGALCSHQDPNNCDRERDCPAFVALPKTTSERVDKLRKDRAALGLKRKEVYVHDDDWPELLKLAKRLERRRAKLMASGAG
jgi:hypothetical protein